MDFETYFKLSSYIVVVCGVAALCVTGGIGFVLTGLFLALTIIAWFFEDTKWQITERWALFFIIILLPIFFLDWKYRLFGGLHAENGAAETLSRIILSFSAIKLMQRKADRDWVFLYLIAFFEVLLGAGISISPLFLVVFVIYLLFAIATVLSLEIRKTRALVEKEKWKLESTEKNQSILKVPAKNNFSIFRLPITATGLLICITVFALPLFFVMPRVGGAGMGKSTGGGSSTFVGFSDSVNLGAIGKIQQNDTVVMRVRIENANAQNLRDIRWRGVALDYFNNRSWIKTQNANQSVVKNENGIFEFGKSDNVNKIVRQTMYMETVDTPIVFVAPRVLGIQGEFSFLNKDGENSFKAVRDLSERMSYTVFSDMTQTSPEVLAQDRTPYSEDSARYLRLPDDLDPQIAQLGERIIREANAKTRLDKAKAIENYLKTTYNYSLDLKVGGTQPLADFLFNVKEGHCEYFATSLAILLRTQGIATRIVNGFQLGNYNSTADFYTVRERDAHSWVEVYFPEKRVWATFDATPPGGFNGDESQGNAGFLSSAGKYSEALEMFWLEYVVGYDNQSQKSLAKSFTNGFVDYQNKSIVGLLQLQAFGKNWWQEITGEKGFESRITAITSAVGIGIFGFISLFLLWFFAKKLRRSLILKKLLNWFRRKDSASVVKFYQRMTEALARQGFNRAEVQTPLEFANALGIPEAVLITERYNRVRFGEKVLDKHEAEEVELWLSTLEKSNEK